MIYVDTSVLLAQLLAEDRIPREAFWREPLISSRLAEYETWVRLNRAGLDKSHGEAARILFHRMSLLELTPPVLARALEPFPAPVRTLDALHLASAIFVRERDAALSLATYDDGLAHAARALRLRVIQP